MDHDKIKILNSQASGKDSPVWLSRVMSHNTFINFFSDYVSLPCFVVCREDLDTWYILGPSTDTLRPYHFETYYGKRKSRDKYFEESFMEAARTGQPFLGRHMGQYDFFIPVMRAGECVAFVMSGSFLKSVPTLDQLIHEFTEISGSKPTQTDPQFLNYCRVALDTQVLDEDFLPHYREFLQLVARLVAADVVKKEQVEEIERIKTAVFSQQVPTRMWNYVATKVNRLYWGSTQLTELAQWDRDEFHLSRHPTVVLAVMLHDPGAKRYLEVASMIQAAEMQLACFRTAKDLPETISGRMGQDGAYFLTSPNPSWSPVKTKLKIRDMALSIEASLRKQFKSRVFIGVSDLTHTPMELPEAFKESVQALHLGLHLQKPQLFFEDHYLVADDRSGVSLYEWAPRLVNACSQGTEKEIHFIREQYIKEAIQLSGEKMESLRIHFFHLLFFLLELIQKRSLLMDSKVGELRGELIKKFNQANTITDLLSLFRFYLERLSQIFQKPSRGERTLRLEQTKEFIFKNFQQAISLKDVASQAGLSVPHFSRHFKQMFGVGFLEYLIQVRCDKAKRLLETTRFPIGHIAQECGFHSTNHFIQCFKHRMKRTPGNYRKKKNPKAAL